MHFCGGCGKWCDCAEGDEDKFDCIHIRTPEFYCFIDEIEDDDEEGMFRDLWPDDIDEEADNG